MNHQSILDEFITQNGRLLWNRERARRKKQKIRTTRRALFVQFLHSYGVKASNPGIQYILAPKNFLFERFFWCVIYVVMGAIVIALLHEPWVHLRRNPTVVSIDKNFRSWRTFLPAVTFCPVNAFNETKARDAIKTHWNTSEWDDARFKYILEFIKEVVNLKINRKSLSAFQIYSNDSSLQKVNMLELAMQAVNVFPARFNVHQEDYNRSKFNLSIFEVGLCQTFGGVLSQYFPFRRDLNLSFEPPQCFYTSASCYGFMEVQNVFEGGKVYLHSPYEVVTLESRFVGISLHRTVGLEFTSQEMLSSDSLRGLSIPQRNCKFMEDVTYASIPVYSYNICKMHCRKQLAIQLCGCSPYLYYHVGSQNVCDARGLVCIRKHLKNILKFENLNGSRIDCHCFPNCNEVLVSSFTDENAIWSNDRDLNFSRFVWNIQKFPRERYVRSVLYNFEDFIVSLGSMIGFFLGGSLLSQVEFLYFFTLRLFWYCRAHNTTPPENKP